MYWRKRLFGKESRWLHAAGRAATFSLKAYWYFVIQACAETIDVMKKCLIIIVLD
jgi:hypothetical protein